MRIVKPGKTQGEMDPEKEITCWKCEAILAYKKKDVKMSFKLDIYIECPNCKSFIDVVD